MNAIRSSRTPSTLALALALAGCSSASSHPSTSGSGSLQAATLSPTGQCSTGECDESTVAAYGTCVEKACDADYQMCFGPGYASGNYNGGPCETTYSCLAKCTCGDNACLQSCPEASTACQECIGNNIQICAANSGCTPPVCGDASVKVTAAHTCADLAKCCAAITDATEHELCTTEYSEGAGDGDIVCNAFVEGFEMLGYCP